MRIAITGGSGGVGRAFIKVALEQGHSVVSIDRLRSGELDSLWSDAIEADFQAWLKENP